jgi:2C-methyl-D-erythritol 2,4-cyclodiphosphate synthase
MDNVITEAAKQQANQLGNTGDTVGNILMTLIGAVEELENRINNIKQCICEDICVKPEKVVEPKKVSKTTKRSK